MRGLVIERFGAASEALKFRDDLPTPDVAPDQLLIRVRAAAINPSDVKNLSGKMPGTKPPRIPGRDFAGVVERGPGDWVGKEVFGTGGGMGFARDGTQAEFVAVPRDGVVRKPGNLSFEQAASVGVVYVTAWSAIRTAAGLAAGETLLVIGAAGGVGAAAIQIAKLSGARPIIAVVRHAEQRDEVIDNGASHVIVSGAEDVAPRVEALTNGSGAAVAFDTSGGNFGVALACGGLGSRVPVITAPPDGQAQFDLRSLYRKQQRVVGVDSMKLSEAACAAILRAMLDGFESGVLRPRFDEAVSLADAPLAYERASRGGGGKRTVITI